MPPLLLLAILGVLGIHLWAGPASASPTTVSKGTLGGPVVPAQNSGSVARRTTPSRYAQNAVPFAEGGVGATGNAMSTSPGATRRSFAPMVSIKPCLAKLRATRSA